MHRHPQIIRSIIDFRTAYTDLQAGDLVLGLLPLKSGEEIKLTDLLARGVKVFPSVLAQLLNRSKAAQASVLTGFKVPGTFVAYNRADLAARLPDPALQGQVVAKADKAHLGLGVSLWPSLEALVSLAGVHDLPYPLVVQPFVQRARDVRAVVVGDYTEAYERVNPHSFRKNLFQGGSSGTVVFEPEHRDFCRRIMVRGQFPYAVLDLLLSPQGEIFLSEISLKGGLKGSQLGQAEFRARVRLLEEECYRTWASSLKTPT